MSLFKSGETASAQVLKLATNSSPSTKKKIKEIHNLLLLSSMAMYTPEEALALIVDCSLSKDDIRIQRGAKKKQVNIYPSYAVIGHVTKTCYPANITISVVHILRCIYQFKIWWT
ncbi:unnamed protein product [Psylliodes chrysocephalus]|uniref:Uncharacterized protein n=1 Tax=Psylliodes chrysocephalus TaxID=3402493 RepID=A0A9P0CYS7_9CUCU|nr:unnamed protein product [Psylliodes chrysocephala]